MHSIEQSCLHQEENSIRVLLEVYESTTFMTIASFPFALDQSNSAHEICLKFQPCFLNQEKNQLIAYKFPHTHPHPIINFLLLFYYYWPTTNTGKPFFFFQNGKHFANFPLLILSSCTSHVPLRWRLM